MKFLKSALILLSFLILSACNLAQAHPVAVVPPTVPYIQIAQVTTQALPSPSRVVQAIETNTPIASSPTPQATLSPYTCGLAPEGKAMRHTVLANIDYTAKTAHVSQKITYRNDGEVALEDLVLNVEAHTWDNAFVLERVMIRGEAAYESLEANRLVVFLPSPLNPACQVEVDLQFTIHIPRMAVGANALKGYFGYNERQINLAMWLPTVTARRENQWLLHEPQTIGEQAVLEQADWDVTLNVSNATTNLVIAAQGAVTRTGENQWRYIFNGARDFPISLSLNYTVASETTRNGVIVELYHFGDTVRPLASGGTANGAPHAIDLSVKAIEQFSALFGQYPYERMVVIQGDFPDGMEFSGFVFVSTNWFYGFEGGLQNYLSVITVHEVAHQWWYASVGNDSALDPWLDEAFATYSEYIFYEEFYPDLKNWWWSFRVAWYNPQGTVNSSVYDFESGRDYINAVYLRGVQMLHNLREDLGTEDFFNWLAAYAEAGKGTIAAPDLVWSLLSPAQLAVTSATREEFLQEQD